MTAGLIDEIVIFDLLALCLAVATVNIIWYVVKKAFPDEVRDLRFFLTFIVVIVPFVLTICFGVRHHKLRCDRHTVRLAASVAVTRLIVVADHRCGNFLCRPNAVAMVELA